MDAAPPWLPWIAARAAAWLTRFPERLFAGTAADGVVSLAEAVGLVNATPFPLDEAVAALLAPPAADAPPRLPLAEAFGLDAAAQALLLAAAAPGLSVPAARLYRFLRTADGTPDLGFLAELVGLSAAAALAATAPHAPLIADGLLTLGPGAGLCRPVQVPDEVLLALAGGALPAAEHAPAPWPGALQARLEAALAAEAALVWVLGRRGTGRRGALAAAGPTAFFDPTEHPPAAWGAAAHVAERRARLQGRRLALLLDDVEDGAALWRAWQPRVPCVCLAARVDQAAGDGPRRVVHAPALTPAQRIRQWQDALGADGRVWDPGLADRLAARFDAHPQAMALALADVDGEPTAEALFSALRPRLGHGLDALAQPVATTLGFADLVLPAPVVATLDDIVAHARHRDEVLHGWGFDRLLPYGRGLGCLFAGPPGTGKTMVAGILANALDREIYRVDTARLVSKWIGETEKNMARLFEAAERARAVVFFDEADSLFGKRTEVRGSNDRFANMEVNDLLQRMERFDGISILATNLHQSMDDAFRRRFRFIVHFEEPDAAERARLWSRMLPPRAPRAPHLDFDALGRRFKLTGGHIKNAVVRAAYGAAAQGRPIDQALLTQAAQDEVHALGRLS